MSFILTPKELAMWYQGQVVHGLLPLGEATEIAKSIGAITSGEIPNLRNIIYGAEVWSQLNRERNIFAYLPKTKWVRSGWRVLTGYGTSAPEDIALASEDAAIPAAVKPEVQTLKVNPAPFSMAFEMSLLYEAFVNAGVDDMAITLDQLRKLQALEFTKRLNQLLGKKVIGSDRATSVDPATDSIIPLDRIVSGYPESQFNGGTAGNEVGDYVDVYGIDRHTAESWADSVIIHNNGTPGLSLTLDLLADTILHKVPVKGGQTSVIITHPSTYAKIVQLFMNIASYYIQPGQNVSPFAYTSVEIGNEGVRPAKSIDGGMTVTSIFGVPMVMSVDIPQDGIGRVYGLDLNDPEGYGFPRMSISVAMPTTYFEIRNPAMTGKPVVRGVYVAFMNTVARRLNTHFKIRDLQ